jgi:putative tryptophan/tyrosine transport system substrate-binding protein
MISARRAEWVEFAASTRLPLCSDAGETARVGGLVSYAPLLTEHYVLAAAYVDKILKGAKPADLPVEEPTRYELIINLKTAKALGLTIPQSVLLRAEEVLQ